MTVKKTAEQSKPDAKAPEMVAIVIGTSPLGETDNVSTPDPDCSDGSKWLNLPRNERIEVDPRVPEHLKTKFHLVNVEKDGKLTPVRYDRFPISYVE